MTRYDITLSREAGVYTTTLNIKAETKDEAESIALEQAKQMRLEEWKYDDACFQYFSPLIQVEGTEQLREDSAN